MLPYLGDYFYNPSATYMAARKVRTDLETARAKVASWLGVRSSEIVFTAGGTEANNLAIHGIMRQYPQANVVVSAIEHESVLEPARHYDCRELAVRADGLLDLDDLRSKIDDRTVLVSVMYANNEIGTVQSLRSVGQLIATIVSQRGSTGLPLYFHSDACQAGNYLDMHVSRLGVDLLTLNGGKLYGPKQSGSLYVRAGLKLLPLVDGGGQERGLRSGTENVAGAVGFAAAFELAQESRHQEVKRLGALQRQFGRLLATEIPGASINGSQKHRLPNNIHVTFPGYDNERLLIQLDEAGIMAAAGSACSASDEESSHVLRALGMSDSEARSSIRFTLGRTTTEAMIDRVVATLRSLVAGALGYRAESHVSGMVISTKTK